MAPHVPVLREVRAVLQKLAALAVTVRVEDVPVFLGAARDAGWSAVDSGERLTTEDGLDKEAVLVVRIPRLGSLEDGRPAAEA